MPAHDDAVLTVLIARMDDMREDVRATRSDVQQLLTSLPQQYVPRAELEERRRLVDERQAATDKQLQKLAKQPAAARNSRRWAIGLTVSSLLSLAALGVDAASSLAH